MTPEQRETLEKLALRYVNGPHAILTHAEYTALRAALAPAPTCGTCRWLHFHDVQKNIGYCSRWHDAASGAYAVVYPIVAVSDRPAHYCAAHEPTEPTEPTR